MRGPAEAGMLNSPAPPIATIHRIPPEILSEIFLHCLPIDLASQDTQQLLSSVCRRWRALVLATPALWASLDILCDFDVPRPPLPVIRTHLQRSGAHPLSFVLRTVNLKNADGNDPHLPSVLMTLATARQRWYNVEIRLFRVTQDCLDLITQGGAPLLRSVICDTMLPEQGFLIPLHTLDLCPRLESFQWISTASAILLPPADTQLTSLSLRAKLSVSECITLLRLSPRLSRALFYILNSSGPSDMPRLTHPTLRTLSITGECSIMLLDNLTLPSLLDLDLTNAGTQIPLSPEWDTALPAFLERSRPTLHKLSLCMGDTSVEPTIMRILTLASHLRILVLARRLDSASLTAALIHALHPQFWPGAPLCPQLQTLVVLGILHCPDGLWTAMLRARWGAQAHANGVACLEAAYTNLMDGVHDCDRENMEELRALGMQGTIDLRVSCSDYEDLPGVSYAIV